MYLLGFDIGSSSVKASLIDSGSGTTIASSYYPRQEMAITARQPGWAEQDPGLWWENLKLALGDVMQSTKTDPRSISAIGISYQMHGLVMVDRNYQVIRPSIIWCDSRAASIGDQAFASIGESRCLSSLLNSPGNFTASKLKWVKEFEPANFEKIYKIMLPGDYIAMRLTGDIRTTVTGLSEGILWDFKNHGLARMVLDTYGFDDSVIPDIVPVFGHQGYVSALAANDLGLAPGTPVTYRAGDQPNNALSLNVLQPGEVAATAGTSGVVYGVSSEITFDPASRVNTFAHVNHTENEPRLGVLLCINGTGILNAWLRKNATSLLGYEEMNQLAATVSPGSEGLVVLPFGNGAERVLKNKDIGSVISGLNYNIHTQAHLLRAAQEGIVFSFKYGMEIMESTGIQPKVIRAGKANMFLSPVFRETLADITGATIELYNTDGSAGAARGAGIGAGIYANFGEAFAHLKKLETIEPGNFKPEETEAAYAAWKEVLENQMKSN
ncbi:sugar (pentulose/hexulose) kinase [Bacteroidales bacterium 6E]|nr:sugar (pentulose/hexulose) kinase [Bacteroidales bacterium 6E]